VPHIDIDELVRLETSVWQALADGDPDADARMLSEDFLGVYPSGFSDRDDHARQLLDGATVERFELHDARTLVVSDSAVMLVYRAVFRRPSAIQESPGESTDESMYVSSLWCHRDDGWVNVFSQDTPVDA
jgi:hypothetical protein